MIKQVNKNGADSAPFLFTCLIVNTADDTAWMHKLDFILILMLTQDSGTNTVFPRQGSYLSTKEREGG